MLRKGTGEVVVLESFQIEHSTMPHITKEIIMKSQLLKILPRAPLVVLCLAMIVAGSTQAFDALVKLTGLDKRPQVNVTINETPLDRVGKGLNSFSAVVKKVSPSVVMVYTETKSKRIHQWEMPFKRAPSLRQFFGNSHPGRRGMPELRTPESKGLGSGVIVSPEGYILTNNHVIDGADVIHVSLTGRKKQYRAEVVGKDPKTDIAVLKINAEDLPHIILADSDQTRVGDIVLAVGNPFGIGQTVTMGMVSAMGRSASLGMEYEDFIQTDAAINPGNSGGALVDAEGRLIGINTAILSRSGGNNGIGFAVPVNLARNVMESLVENGEVIRGYLGVYIQNVTENLAEMFDLEESSGALVSQVIVNSPADRAGILSGDIIQKYNGKTIEGNRELQLKIAQTSPHDSIELTIIREGKIQTVKVDLAVKTDDQGIAQQSRTGRDSRDSLSGVTIDDLSLRFRRQFGTPRNLEGAVVVEVDRDSPAFAAGLRPGDVIQSINRQLVENAEDAVTISEKMGTPKILLKIWSQGGSKYLVVADLDVG
jgi:serine protease Do